MNRSSRHASPHLWLCLALIFLALHLPGCGIGYVLDAGYHQMALLEARQPVEDVRAHCALTPEQTASLDRVADAKAFGRAIGLAGSANYETVAVGWDHTIWNISGCDPLAFEPETWWFPIVGTVPYLGFFVEEDARAMEDELKSQGLDVFVRIAGAYSTLGWFEDPILVPMLDWRPFRLVETVLHELTHATVWIPGSVAFNESFANFVGEEAALRYMQDRHGEGSPQHLEAIQSLEDEGRWRAMLKGLYDDLEALYSRTDLSDEAKLARKAALLGSIHDRIDAAGFNNPEGWHRAAARRTWNNALLVQFRTYNNNRQWFEAVYERCDRDLLTFMAVIEGIAADADDPFEALREAAEAQKPPALSSKATLR